MKNRILAALFALIAAAAIVDVEAAQSYRSRPDMIEGTWTPTYTPETGTSAVTYDTSLTGGIYTKIGRHVCVQGFIRTTAVGAGGSDSVRVSLPFAAATTTPAVAARAGFVIPQASAFVTNTPLYGQVLGGNAYMTPFYRATVNGVGVGLTWADMTTGAPGNMLNFSGCYRAAQ
jgi:hypothetical protein